MQIRGTRLAVAILLGAVFVFALAGGVLSATRRAANATVAAEALGGRDRYRIHVATDKPIYRAGEMVYVRAVVLHAANKKPYQSRDVVGIEIKGPRGDTVATGQAHLIDGAAGYAWQVPPGQAGGVYTLVAEAPRLGTPPAERTFDIRAYRLPRINTQIEFLREGYGPGDTVGAVLEAVRAEGGAPAGAAVMIVARVDGAEVYRAEGVIDDEGRCMARFDLPAEMAIGDGTLAFTLADGGVVETAAKTIPIVLQTLDLRLYPEGGELVAGLLARVYIEARTPNDKPADIAGVVLDADDKPVAEFSTEHEGRGRFAFTPEAGKTYRLNIVKPAGITRMFELSPALASGATIQTVHDVYPGGKPVVLRVLSNVKGPLTLTLRRLEEEVAAIAIREDADDAEPREDEATLTPPAAASGVLIATVWGPDGTPLAERLLYREPETRLRVTVEPDRERYTPGGAVTLVVTATDEAGAPAEAVVGLTVTDESVLEMIETRDQAPRLPVMVMLEQEVRELADAHVYLDPDNPDAPRAVDRLLGTQGWRRFALVRYEAFVKEHGDAARRALAVAVRKAPPHPPRPAAAFGELVGRDLVRREAIAGVPLADGLAAVPPAPPEAAPVPEAAQPARQQPGPIAIREADAIDAEEWFPREERGRRSRLGRPYYVTIREYAHKARPDRRPGDRVDFTETLYWNAGVKTDPQTGRATVAFALNDSVTCFRVAADAFTARGALGSGDALIESVQPFYLEPKLPMEVTMGDRVTLPISVVNAGDSDLAEVVLNIVAAQGISVGDTTSLAVASGARPRQLVDLSIGELAGDTLFRIEAKAAPYGDTVTRLLRVAPRGFPVERGQGGMLVPDSAMTYTIRIPETLVPGSLTSAVTVHTSPLANLTEALEGLIRHPHGCFEQTASTTYPLVMAQRYFLSHHGVDPGLIERSRDMLDKGYKRLAGFECKGHGFEWFGADPGHETLTAYGLLLFTDMAKVYPVDAALVQRSREWLLRARDGKGGFKRERRALHTWIEDRDCSNAYIVWALLESGETPDSLKHEVDTVKKAAQSSANSYVVALGANVAWLAGDHETARRLMRRLADLQDQSGVVTGATATIVGSGGQSLLIETTSLAALAWLRDPEFTAPVERSIRWLAGICKGGRFGSTQSTVLALRVIVAYDEQRSAVKIPGSLQLAVNGRLAGSAVEFDGATREALQLTDIAELLEPGEHTIEIRMKGGSELPATITIRYTDEKPDSHPDCKLDLHVALSEQTVAEGAVLEANVTVENREEDQIVPMPLAIIGIPGGLEVCHDRLKELVAAERIASYEVLGRDVVLYWRELQAGRKAEAPLRLIAEIPGVYTGPASRAYLYYSDEYKTWANPLRVTITAAD